jgi:RimJ/RimL family protein N-acetyltransferase
MTAIERFGFYDMARKSYAVIQTGERRFYGCFMFRKGVIPPEATRAVIDYAFTELGHDSLSAGARVTNPASRRVLEKCGFQWTGVGLYRIRALKSSAPVDRFRLDRGLWASLKSWSNARRI